MHFRAENAFFCQKVVYKNPLLRESIRENLKMHRLSEVRQTGDAKLISMITVEKEEVIQRALPILRIQERNSSNVISPPRSFRKKELHGSGYISVRKKR